MYRWVFVLALAATACGASPPASTSGVDRIVAGVRGVGWSHFNLLDPFNPIKTYVVSADGRGEVAASLPPGMADEPRWSPDRRWVVYSTTERTGFWTSLDSLLYLMRVDGSQRIQLSDNYYDGRHSERHPVWSPDGTRIAYEAGGIRVLNVECYLRGEHCHPQPINVANGYDPQWSSDGKRIVYSDPWSRTTSHILIVNAAGGEPDDFLAGLGITNMRCRVPEWSTDGRKVVMWCGNPYIETT